MSEQLANNAATTLSGNGGSITAVATDFFVANASQFPTTGNFRILMGTELALVGGVTGNHFTSVTRGIESTTPAIHLDGDAVTHILTAGGIIQAIVDRQTPSGLVLIEEHSGGVASIDFKTRNKNGFTGNSFQSDFDDYIFKFISVYPSTAAQDFRMRVSTNSGASWITTASYYWSWIFTSNVGGTGAPSASGDTSVTLFTQIANVAGIGVKGQLEFIDPLASVQHGCIYDLFAAQSGFVYRGEGFAYFDTGTNDPLNAVQFYFPAGNINGTVRLYGVSK